MNSLTSRLTLYSDLPEDSILSRLAAIWADFKTGEYDRSALIARVNREVKRLLRDEDAVVLPQVFGLQDASVPAFIRQGLPVRVVFAGTLPPSVPGIRTQMLLKRRYEELGGTFLGGDEVVAAHVHEGVVHSVATRNLDSHYLEAGSFLLASGAYFSKGLTANPFGISEPVFGLDVEQAADRSDWYNPDFDAALRALRDGRPLSNLYAIGSILGATRPEFGTGAGLAVRSAFAAVDEILRRCAPQDDK